MKNKILIIDDESNKGWKAILKHLLFEHDQVVSATTINRARGLIAKNLYDLIFLDLRFGEKDHQTTKLKEFGGYELIEKIRENFLSENFATPVILFTASNKAWFINGMLDAGCDDYYIKEHPDTAYDQEFTKQNTKRLKKIVATLLTENRKRKSIHSKIKSIVGKTETEIKNPNIRKRILDKLKIGYGNLFQRMTSFETNKFVFRKEEMAFIVFWSILEEFSKDFFKDRWIKDGKNEGMMGGNNWIFRNGNKFIEDKTFNGGKLIAKIKWNQKKRNYIKSRLEIDKSHKDYSFHSGKINLSLQIYAVMLIYKEWKPDKAKREFKDLNDYRNQIDFIHSSTSSIFNASISENQNEKKAKSFQYNKKIINFLLGVLS